MEPVSRARWAGKILSAVLVAYLAFLGFRPEWDWFAEHLGMPQITNESLRLGLAIGGIALIVIVWLIIFYLDHVRLRRAYESKSKLLTFRAVDPIDGQGPRHQMQEASADDLSRDSISDRVVNIIDLIVNDTITGKKLNHCIIYGPAKLSTGFVKPHNERQPFSHGQWDLPPSERFESLEQFGEDGVTRLQGKTFFQNCDFYGIKFRLTNKTIDEIHNYPWTTP